MYLIKKKERRVHRGDTETQRNSRRKQVKVLMKLVGQASCLSIGDRQDACPTIKSL
jgi:hypothetical protein